MLAMPLTGQAAEIGNVTIYGKARSSVNAVDTGTTNLTSISSNSSRLGFKGSEDLGSGLKALFQFETLVNLDDGAGSTSTLFGTARNSYIGLAGNFGTVITGVYDTPYKDASRLDLFGDTMADYNTIIGDIGDNDTTNEFDRREPNSMQYWSPKFEGLQFRAGYRLDETSDINQDRYSLALVYENGPYFASAAYEEHKKEVASAFDTSGLKFGLGYTFNQEKTKLGLVYEKLAQDGAVSIWDRDAWYLALSHKMDNNTLRVAYGHANENDLTADSGADFYAVGLGHKLGARTEIYALYAQTSNDTNGGYGLGTTGGSGAVVNTLDGQDLSTFSIGINHDF